MIPNLRISRNSLAGYSQDMSKEARVSLLAYDKLAGSCLRAILSGQLTQTTTIMQSMNQHFENLQVEMDKNKALQEQLIQMQQQMMHMQQEALDRLASIHGQVQALAIQTYELHEYPIPRLFIVLPKMMRRRDRLAKPFSEQFQLFFLCECGEHTMNEESKTQHEIHLAKHEGYDLDKSTEFFEKYGSYVLTLMYMIKYGIAAAGLFVQPLASTKLLSGLDLAQEHLRHLGNIGPLVDDTIRFLQDMKTTTQPCDGPAASQTESKKVEALEGADLRQLESYLKVQDEGRVLGNLYRTITPEGHVKWVCFDHYRSNYRNSATEDSRAVVEANGGKFTEETGKVEIKVSSNVAARQFYDAIAKARGIQELEFTFGWDATMDDLRDFAEAVTKANITRLIVDGSYLKGSTRDVVYRSRRFDPLLNVASNGRIQYLRLKNFDRFFSRVNVSLGRAPKLRVLSIESEIPFTEKTTKSYFNGLLERCPSLKSLELKLNHQYSPNKATHFILSKLQHLEFLVMDCGRLSITAKISQGKIRGMKMTIARLHDLNEEDLALIKLGHLTRLAIEYTPQDSDEDRLSTILHQNSNLRLLQIGCLEERCLAVVKLVVSTRAEVMEKQGPPCLRVFELMSEKLIPLKTGPFDGRTYIQSRLSFDEDSNTFDMRTSIRLQDRTQVSNEHPVWDFIREYGWSVVCLVAPRTINNELAAVLDDITMEKGSRLEVLRFSPHSLTSSGLDCLDRVIHRSENFRAVGLFLHNLEDDGQVAAAGLLLRRYEKTLDYLGLYGNSLKWLPKLGLLTLAGCRFSRLETFGLAPDPRCSVPSTCVPWIANMVSASRQPGFSSPPVSPRRQEFRLDAEAIDSWPSLKHVSLQRLVFRPEDWKVIIEAMNIPMLEHMDFKGSNFSQEQLKVLIDRIPDNGVSTIPLKVLDVADTDLPKGPDTRALLGILQRKAPFVKVMGLSA
ncbi:hypothetical protein BGX34_010881 [Mortierella sp. NVP85]|nr:hypothetical protein BGX34_010881 [Mortierella sp. NVP85]